MPMSMHKAEIYGGHFSNRGSRRKADIVGASIVISMEWIRDRVLLAVLLTY